MGALQLCRNSLSISSRGSRGLRDHPGFSGALRSQRRPISITVARGAVRPIGRGGNLRASRPPMDGVEGESSGRPAICVNRLCNSQAWVKCHFNGFSLLEGAGWRRLLFSWLCLSFSFLLHYSLLFFFFSFHCVSTVFIFRYFSSWTPANQPCTNYDPV